MGLLYKITLSYYYNFISTRIRFNKLELVECRPRAIDLSLLNE